MAGSKKATIIVATHKKYRMPDDKLYLPLHVGAEGKFDAKGNPVDFGYQKDNTGENISLKNPKYCELTGMYWAYKNLDADYIGLVHYRRYFGGRRHSMEPFDSILTGKELAPMLDRYKVFVPVPQHYFIETLYSHYAHTHHEEHLDIVRHIISEKCPSYLHVFDKVMRRTSGYMFNMMIMEKRLFHRYCKWLFMILGELEKRVDDSCYDPFEARFYGRVSEIIFNVWLEYQIEQKAIDRRQIKKLPLVYMERINWIRKCNAFLRAKFFGEKYSNSF